MSIEHTRTIVFLAIFAVAGSTATMAASDPASTPAPAASKENGGGVVTATEPANGVDGAEDSPVAVIEELNASLEGVLREAETLGYEGRLERLRPILEAAFDFDYMARKTVGQHWSELSPEEQQRWVELFKHLSEATYAGRFTHYTGQKFELVGQEPGAGDTVIVRSKVIDPGEEDVNLSYRLGKTAKGWQVIDVYFKGTVSELAMRRADYSAVLENDGFEALAARVNERIAEIKAEATP